MPQLLKPYTDAALQELSVADYDIHEPLTLAQRGNRFTERTRTATTFTLGQFVLTGYYAKPNDTIGVYVHADENGPRPRIVMATICQYKDKWYFGYDGRELSNGYNEIKLKDMKGCQAIYFYNPAIPSEQAFAPVVRLVGGTEYPVYYYNSEHPEESETSEHFKERLAKYCEEVTDIDAEADAGKGKPNICEFTSDKMIVSTSARGALIGIDQPFTWNKGMSATNKTYVGAKDTMMAYDMMYDDMMLYSGFNMDDPTHEDYKPYCQFLLRLYTNGGGWGWGQDLFAGINAFDLKDEDRWDNTNFSSVATPGCVMNAGWGMIHEVGHVFDNSIIGMSESTNNLYGLMSGLKYQGENRLDWADENRWYKHFTNCINTGLLPHNDLLFYPAAVIYQLDAIDFSDTTLYKDEGISNYGRGCRYARLHRNELNGMPYNDKLIISMSMGAGVDLTDHFEFYQRTVSDEARYMLKGLPKNTKPTWYVNDRTFRGGAMSDALKEKAPEVESIKTDETTGAVTIKMKDTVYREGDNSDKNLQCFELYRTDTADNVTTFAGISGDDKTTKNINELYIFNDFNVVPGHTYKYTICAYDCKLDKTRSVETETVTVPGGAEVPVKSLIINDGNVGTSALIGTKVKIVLHYFPANTTTDLNTIKWEVSNNDKNTIRLEDDPDYPNDPTHKIAVIVGREGTARIKASVDGVSREYDVGSRGGSAPISELKLDADDVSLAVGGTRQINAKLVPEYTTNTNPVTWSSSDGSVASVNNGIIKANAAGTAQITASVTDSGTRKVYTAVCNVTVAAAQKVVTDVTVNSWAQGEPELIIGEDRQLTVQVSPSDATNITPISWSVEAAEGGEPVAEISQTGILKGLRSGTAVVKAETGGVTGTLTVKVRERIPVKSIGINYNSYELTEENSSVKLELTTVPENADGADSVAWVSSNPKVASVSEDGTVTAAAAGNAVITGYRFGKTASCNVKVSVFTELTGLQFRKKEVNENISIALTEEETYQLQLAPVPMEASGLSNTVWSSDKPEVAAVDAVTGFVTAKSAGEAVITGSVTQKTPDGDVTKELRCTVTVNAKKIPLDGVSINTVSHRMKPGETIKLTLTMRPLNANIGVSETIWESDNSEIASVDADGAVTAGDQGTAVITGTIGNCSEKCIITVEAERKTVDSLTVTGAPSGYLKKGETCALGVTTDTEGVEIDTSEAYWRSDNSNIVRVDGNGTITAVNSGKANIYVTAYGKTAKCGVTVLFGSGGTDSGYYTKNNEPDGTKNGIIRFLQNCDIDGITEYGFEFTDVNGEPIANEKTSAAGPITGGGFFGQLIEIPETYATRNPWQEKYYVKAYVVIDGTTYYSDVIEGSVGTNPKWVFEPQESASGEIETVKSAPLDQALLIEVIE